MREFLRDSFKKGFPLFLAISLSVCVFFIIYRFQFLNSGLSSLIGILKPFVIGGAIAYLLKRPYNFFLEKLSKMLPEKLKGFAKIFSVIIVLVVTLALIVVLLLLVLPALANSLMSISKQLPSAMDSIIAWLKSLDPKGNGIPSSIATGIQTAEIHLIPWLTDNVVSNMSKTLSTALSTVAGILGILYNLMIGVIICIYLLLGKETFARQGKMVVYALFQKERADWVIDEFRFIDKVFNGFFAGRILDSAIVGLICFAVCTLMHFTLGLNNVVLISVIVGVMNIVPFFGPYLGGVPGAVLALLDGPVTCVAFIVFIFVLQTVDGNYIGPRCLAGGVGLSAFWCLFAITLFGGIMGIVGIIVGVPIFAVIYDLIKKAVHLGLKKNNAEVLIE